MPEVLAFALLLLLFVVLVFIFKFLPFDIVEST